MSEQDYEGVLPTIQRAMVAESKRRKRASGGPGSIVWGGKRVFTSYVLVVPPRGRLSLELIRAQAPLRQGVDLKMKGGCILADGSVVPVLRTWFDPELEDRVEYDYVANDGRIATWNVYEVKTKTGRFELNREENAGMWVEERSATNVVYHCSHGRAYPPDFESLVYRSRIL